MYVGAMYVLEGTTILGPGLESRRILGDFKPLPMYCVCHHQGDDKILVVMKSDEPHGLSLVRNGNRVNSKYCEV